VQEVAALAASEERTAAARNDVFEADGASSADNVTPRRSGPLSTGCVALGAIDRADQPVLLLDAAAPAAAR
jgi:hypothetical protein